MAGFTANIKWGRVLAAGVAAQFVDDLLLGIPFLGWVLTPVGSLVVAAATFLLAMCVGRTVGTSAALRHGILVGAIAGVLGLVIGLPGLALLPALVALAAGALGGLAGTVSGRSVEDESRPGVISR